MEKIKKNTTGKELKQKTEFVINKEEYPDIFTKNDEMPVEDIRLLHHKLSISDIVWKSYNCWIFNSLEARRWYFLI